MVSTTNWQQEIAPELLYRLLTEYDRYIQQASKNGCYKIDQWVPLTIEEFYRTEFMLLTKSDILPGRSEEQSVSKNSERVTWSTFSRQQLRAAKPKPWWRRWLPF